MFLGQGVACRTEATWYCPVLPCRWEGTRALLPVLSSLVPEVWEEVLVVGVGGPHVTRSVSETRGEAKPESRL